MTQSSIRANTPPSAQSSTSLSWAEAVELNVKQAQTGVPGAAGAAKRSQSKMNCNAAIFALPELTTSQATLPLPGMPSVPFDFPTPSTFNSFLFQNAAANAMNPSMVLPALSGLNLSIAPNPNGFALPTLVATNPAASTVQAQLLPQMPAAPAIEQVLDAQPENTQSITASFLRTYYNELYASPGNLEKFYHVDAQIDHGHAHDAKARDCDASITSKLAEFEALIEDVTFVDIDEIVDQKAANSSILIRVSGTMLYSRRMARRFEQIFILRKSGKGAGFWLIHNDMFRRIGSEQSQAQQETQQRRRQQQGGGRSVSMMTRNKYYHDTSYQCFDNNLAVFVRPIPNTLTHANLAALLKTHIEDAQIAYIDVNYHKQFAFVYFDDLRSFEQALAVKQIHIGDAVADIQVKRSKNKPRTFGYPRR